MGVVKWTAEINPDYIFGHELVLMQEALKRKIPIENLVQSKFHTRFFRIKTNCGYYLFETLPTKNSYRHINPETISNKWWVKKRLQKENIPTPIGALVSNYHQALKFVFKHHYPVVIKPVNESKCIGVTVNIDNNKKLKEAIKEVKKYGAKFLVEEYLFGKSYRVTVVANKIVAVCLRRPPQVIGNGKYSIRDLIRTKNLDSRRGKIKSSTLRPIIIDKVTSELLRAQNLSLHSIPEKNRKVILNTKINLGSGADIIDQTDIITPEIAKLSVKVAKICDAKILGLDVLARDISQPPSRKNLVSIIEVNPYPFIDMHHFPYRGKSRNVSGAVLDLLLKDFKIF